MPPAPAPVIPAQAGIHKLQPFGHVDSRLRGSDGKGCAVEAQKLLGISLEESVG